MGDFVFAAKGGNAVPQAEFELELQNGLCTLKSWRGYGPCVRVPDGVEAIGEEAFAGRGVRAVELPGGLRRIGMRAFQKCARLEELDLPDSVEQIGVEAFNGCTALRRVRFGAGLQAIQARAFWHCIVLTEVALPAGAALVGSRAFECCSALQTVTLHNPGVQVDEYAFNETPYCARLLRLAERCTAGHLGGDPLRCPETLILPEGVTHVEHWGFAKSNIRSARLPSSLRTIGMCAFKDCKHLREVSLSPNSYCNYRLRLEPGDGIFADCTELERVIFRGGLRNFTWYDAEEPEVLRGCDREKTFLGCGRLHSILAWELPLDAIPREWRQYALNGFVEDVRRDEHYTPEVAAGYHAWLRGCREQLIRRCRTDHSYALHQYLTDRQMLNREEFDAVFRWAQGQAGPQTMAVLLDYQRRVLGAADPLAHALAGLDEL